MEILSNVNINDLPSEIILMIIDRLSIRPMGRRVCKIWRDLLVNKYSPWIIAYWAALGYNNLIDWCREDLRNECVNELNIFNSKLAVGLMLEKNISYKVLSKIQYGGTIGFINAIYLKKHEIIENFKEIKYYQKIFSRSLDDIGQKETYDINSLPFDYMIIISAIIYDNKNIFDWYLSLRSDYNNINQLMLHLLCYYNRHWLSLTQISNLKTKFCSMQPITHGAIVNNLDIIKAYTTNNQLIGSEKEDIKYWASEYNRVVAGYYGHFDIYRYLITVNKDDFFIKNGIDRLFIILGGHYPEEPFISINNIEIQSKLIKQAFTFIMDITNTKKCRDGWYFLMMMLEPWYINNYKLKIYLCHLCGKETIMKYLYDITDDRHLKLYINTMDTLELPNIPPPLPLAINYCINHIDRIPIFKIEDYHNY